MFLKNVLKEMLLLDKSSNNNSLILVIKCEDREEVEEEEEAEEVGTTLHKSRQQYMWHSIRKRISGIFV